jgi:penicillin-binding protein 2
MMNKIAARASELGLGVVSGLGINGEVPGLVPDEDWHRSRPDAGGAFSMGHALNTAIGEGATRVTVTQMAMVYAAIANGGRLMQPQLVLRVEDAKGKVLEEFPPRERRVLAVAPATLALLRKSLTAVVNDKKGTAYRVRSSLVLMAGKTGTAQTHLSVKRVGDKATGKGDHAWFAGFAPADDPQVAFAVLVEHGGFGGEVSAPVARHIVESYLGPRAQARAGDAAKAAPASASAPLPNLESADPPAAELERVP